MDEIKCGILYGEDLGKTFRVLNVEVLEGNVSGTAGMISGGLRFGDRRLDMPVSFVKLGSGFNKQIKLYVDLRLCPDAERHVLRKARSGTIHLEEPDQTFALEGKKQLLIVDDSGILPALPVLLGVARSGGSAQVFAMNITDKAALNALRSYVKRMDFSIRQIRGDWERKLAPVMTTQTVGTRIMAFCDWRDFSRMKRIARQAGYANEEVQGAGFGEKEERVFCACCYEMQPRPRGNEMDCVRCGSPLLVSAHYSPRLDAFLGYVNVYR